MKLRSILYESTMHVLPSDSYILKVGSDLEVSDLEILQEESSNVVIPVYVHYSSDYTEVIPWLEEGVIDDTIHVVDIIVNSEGRWSVAHDSRLPSEFYDIQSYVNLVDTDSPEEVVEFLLDIYNRVKVISDDYDKQVEASSGINEVNKNEDDYVRVVFDPRLVRRYLMGSESVIVESVNKFYEMETQELLKYLRSQGVDTTDLEPDPNPPKKEVAQYESSFLMKLIAAKALGRTTRAVLDLLGVKFF